MNIQYFGAAREVGRSCIGVETGELSILLDAGVAPNDKKPLLPEEKFKKPDAIALTHAHLDHSGFLPAIYKHSNPPIITTFPSIPLVNILLEDMQKLLDEKGIPQYFNAVDLKRMSRSFVAIPYETEYEFYDGTNLKLYDAGHILGSSQVLLETEGRRLLYSGDFNLMDTVMHRRAKIPKEKVDCLIMESTYGNREHPNRKKLVKEFCGKIKAAVERRESVIVPSFAVGRTQEILEMLYEHELLKYAVLDGMGIRASDIYM
ncbi:MAG: MBL fold metallo-hydrolase, partial [Candidatus Micrarchaeota archaeon]